MCSQNKGVPAGPQAEPERSLNYVCPHRKSLRMHSPKACGLRRNGIMDLWMPYGHEFYMDDCRDCAGPLWDPAPPAETQKATADE